MGKSSMHTQYIPEEQKLRITLYGGARIVSILLDAIAMLTEEPEDE